MNPLTRALWITAGLALVALAIVGAILPVMPSTIFGIGAAACFAKSSPRLEAWLLDHRWLGPPIRAWRASGAIPLPAKLLALGSMAVSALGVALFAPPVPAILSVVVLGASALFVATRPVAAALG